MMTSACYNCQQDKNFSHWPPKYFIAHSSHFIDDANVIVLPRDSRRPPKPRGVNSLKKERMLGMSQDCSLKNNCLNVGVTAKTGRLGFYATCPVTSKV